MRISCNERISEARRCLAVWMLATAVAACGGGGDDAASPAPAPAPTPLPANVTLVVPFAAGGPTDAAARRLATALGTRLTGTTVLVENTTGEGGTLGADRVAKAAADGQTLLLTDTTMATMSTLYRRLSFDPLEAFEYLGLVQEMPLLLLGRTTLPAFTYGGLQEWMISNRGVFRFADAGLGTVSDLCALALRAATGNSANYLRYRSSAEALGTLIAGSADVYCETLELTAGQVQAGSVKAFAITSAQRIATGPANDVPTLNESGVAGFNVNRWLGLYAPRGTPQAMLDAVHDALLSVLADPTYIAQVTTVGGIVVADDRRSPGGHLQFVRSEADRWRPLLTARGEFAD